MGFGALGSRMTIKEGVGFWVGLGFGALGLAQSSAQGLEVEFRSLGLRRVLIQG